MRYYIVKLNGEVHSSDVPEVDVGFMADKLAKQHVGVQVSVYLQMVDHDRFCYSITLNEDGSQDLTQA